MVPDGPASVPTVHGLCHIADFFASPIAFGEIAP